MYFKLLLIGKRCEYKKEDLVSAKEEVKNGKMSISSAARHFNVPRTTLSDHVRGRVVNFRSPGPQRQLTDDLEECLVDYLIYMSRQNFPLRRTDTRNLIVVRDLKLLLINFTNSIIIFYMVTGAKVQCTKINAKPCIQS